MNVAADVEVGARQYPQRTAVDFDGRAISYSELNRMASRAAHALATMGVGRGDRVALVLSNTPLFIYCYFGALKLGAIAVSLNPNLTQAELQFAIADSGSRVVIDEACGFGRHLVSGADDLEAVAVKPDDPAAIVYTSGTTGTPKGATLSHGNIRFNSASKKKYLKLEASDRLLLFLPLFHCFGQNAIMNAALHAGATLVLQSGFDVHRVLDCLGSGRANMFFGVPTNFAILLDKATPWQMASVRMFFSAAAPLPRETEQRWQQKFGSVIYQGYGLSETSPFASYNHISRHKPGSIGMPIEGVEMAVVDVEDGKRLGPGEAGEIVVRGPNVMLGYWNRPEETAQAIRHGWFHTGDIGRMDGAGYFTVEDRLKDMVIVGGSNVYPAEVENVLLGHPAVAQAAVFGVPDPVMGETVRAAVVKKAGTNPAAADLAAHCAASLAAYKIPGEIEFVGELPRNPAGKVLKRVLRDRHRPEPTTAPVKSARELELRLMDWLAGKVGLEARESDRKRPFCDLGVTSLLSVELADTLAKWTGMSVTPTIAWSFSSAESLVRHLFEDDAVAELTDEEAEALLLRELELVER